jgi:enterochelin esterase-like enzyme
MEPVADKPGVVLVTFLWRETGPTDNVVLVEWISGLDFPERRMTHLPGTDLWYRSMRLRDHVRTSYQFAPNDSLVLKMDETDWETRQRGWVSDPLNPLTVIDVAGTERPENLARLGDSLVQLPNAAPEPWIVPDPAVPHGLMAHHRFASPSLANERDVWVYTPAGYTPEGKALPVLVLFDGEKHDTVMRVQPVLDNLIAAGVIPPLIALLVGNVDRGIELPCNAPFANAVVSEMLPWLAESYRVTGDSTQRVVAGQSYGGLAAAWCGLTHPETFANVLSQSGSYWWQPNLREDLESTELGDAPGWGWLPTRTAEEPRQAVRFWMEVGTLENRALRHGMPDMVAVNRHMRDVLKAKGYDVTYREYAGGHDYVWWRSGLADGLIALLGHGTSNVETHP